jgi:hypothetical protein
VKSLEKINHLLEELEGELVQLNARRAELLNKITKLQQEKDSLIHGKDAPLKTESLPSVTDRSSQEAKITLFRCLFRGREDVFARRFENPKTGKKGYWPVRRKDWINEGGEFLPLTDEVMKNHLSGVDPQDKYGRDFTIGIYPLLLDETCYFLRWILTKQPGKQTLGHFWKRVSFLTYPLHWKNRVRAKADISGSSFLNLFLQPWREKWAPFF